MVKFTVYFCWIISLFCIAYPVRGESKMLGARAMNESSAEMVAPRPMFEVNALDVKNYYENLVKTRPLTEHENNLRILSLIAGELKVEKFYSYNKEPGALELQNFSIGMVKKMQEHPHWDVALAPQSLTNINSQLELLKKTFGLKSYGWAWFSKQRGEKAEAKKILLEVYEEGFQNIMKLGHVGFDGTSPLTDLQFVQKALEPMLEANDNKQIEAKMQKMKNHISNLPNIHMLT